MEEYRDVPNLDRYETKINQNCETKVGTSKHKNTMSLMWFNHNRGLHQQCKREKVFTCKLEETHHASSLRNLDKLEDQQIKIEKNTTVNSLAPNLRTS